MTVLAFVGAAGSDATADDLRARLQAWMHAAREAVCDVNRPRVEDDPGMTVGQLIAFADEALAGLGHRRIDFDFAEAADPLRSEFTALGWQSMRVVWMHHTGEVPALAGPELTIKQVPFDAVRHLRRAWHDEDHSGTDFEGYYAATREIALRHGARVFAVVQDGHPVAFTQLDDGPRGTEVELVYIAAERRGRGLGTALTRATILAAGDVEDLWIGADDEGRPKELYARLGFRAVGCTMELTRWPAPAVGAAQPSEA